MKQYFDEKMFLTLILVGVTLFFLQHWLTKKYIKGGKMSSYLGNDELGYREI